MKTNVFMKSVLRQPIRTLVLAMLIGIAAFAFVARAAEFVIVRAEIRRVEGLFRSIGMLSPIDPQNITQDHDVTYAAEIIAASRYLAFEDRRVFTQGMLHDRCNTVKQMGNWDFMVPFLEGIDIKVMDHYFYGILATEPRLLDLGYTNYLIFIIEVDGHVVGDPLALRAHTQIFTNERGQTFTLSANQVFYLAITDHEAELWRQGLFFTPSVGRRYMFRGFVQPVRGDFGYQRRGYLRSLGGEDGFRYIEVPLLGRPGATFLERGIVEELRDSNLVFYVDASDQAALDAVRARIHYDIYLTAMNLSSVTVVGTADMSAIPRLVSPQFARLRDTGGGRWLTHCDYINANPVAAVPMALAVRSNLQLGDTFTITLRSNPRPAWIDRETRSRWSRGIEGWWEHAYRGWWGLTATDSDWRDAETYELTLEVVGVYWHYPPGGQVDNFSTNEIFIPASLIPEGFGWCNMPLLTGMYSFNLTSARFQNAFINRYGSAIEELGFTIGFVPNRFEIFESAMAPTCTSITVNLAVFAAVSVLILALVIFLYIRQWSKALAIVRALGMPAGKAMRCFFTPVFCIWTPAIAIGAVVGWFFSINQAESTLAALDILDENISPNIGLFFALFAGIVLLTMAGVISSGFKVAARPVLEQIQGTVQKVRKAIIPEPGVADFIVGEFSIGKPLATNKANPLPTALRHIARRIVRTPVKSALATVLALFFVISLGWMNHTIHFTEAEIERFWDTTVISAEIMKIRDEVRPIGGGFENAYIGQTAVNALLYSGFVQDAYLENMWQWGRVNDVDTVFMGVNCLTGFVAENTRTPLDTQLGVVGYSMELELAPGFSRSDFVFAPGSPVPVVIRQSTMHDMGLAVGDIIIIHNDAVTELLTPFALSRLQSIPPPAYGKIAGYFTGGLNRAVNRSGLDVSFVMPEEFLRYKFQELSLHALHAHLSVGALTYMTARFCLDPARNRELYRLPDLVFAQLAGNMFAAPIGQVPLELLIHDEIIRTVVEPMERNLAILRTLYPISIAAAMVLGFGLSLLVMLTNIKTAAIMRVLGMPRTKTQLSLWLEQFIVCITGIIAGLAVLLTIGIGLGAAPLALAGMYFAGVTLGAAVGAFVINVKTPLELLQVRE